MKNYDSLAKDVWAAQSIMEKKSILIEMVMQFDHREKQTKFLMQISNLKSLAKADDLAAQLMLCDTDKVIR